MPSSRKEPDLFAEEVLEKVRCAGCGRRPEQIPDYEAYVATEFAEDKLPADIPEGEWASHVERIWGAASLEEKVIAARRYVIFNEGTLNMGTGAFTCDQCYIIAGMPSSREGWYVPTGAEWPNQRQSFLDHAARQGRTVPAHPEET